MRGAELARRFYEDAVAPLLAQAYPDLRHLAGRLGSGSDVLGFDDDMSRDHDWGCRLTLLLDAPDLVDDVHELLARHLPDTYGGLPVRFATTLDPQIRHRVEVAAVRSFTLSRLGFDATVAPSTDDWLSVTGQAVLEVTGGPIFHDSTETYGRVADHLRWYPDDIWRYLLASGWQAIEQELPIVGRAGMCGDDVGSRVVTARVAGRLMRLAFLIERRWAPYAKWFGTAMRSLPIGPGLRARLADALAADDWRSRDGALAAAARVLGRRQAAVMTGVAEEVVAPFHDRPFHSVDLAMVAALRAQISDPALRNRALGIGGIEQWVDNVDVLTHPDRRRRPPIG